MKKVIFFTDSDSAALQGKVNEWLSFTKDVQVIETGLTSIVNIEGKERHTFYILYSIVNQEAKEIDQLIQQNSGDVVVTEVKPIMLDASN